MPKLPDDLGVRPTPQYGGQVVSQLRGAAAPALAQAELGQTLGQVGFQMQDKADKLNYARAKSSLLQEQIKTLSDLDKDPDFSTYESRYNERMKSARDASLGLLNNGRDKQAFELDSDNDVLRGLEHVKAKAWAGEKDSAIASVDQLRNDNREAAIRSNDPQVRMGLIKATQEAIDGLSQKNYISKSQAVEFRQKTAQDYAEGIVESMPFDKQIPLLKKPTSLYVAGKPTGLVKAGNLDLTARPRVKNPDGSISTVRSITITNDNDEAVLLPTVIGDKVVSNKEAVEHYWQTGENLGVFKNQKAADAYGQALHEQQAQMYAGSASVADLIPSDKRQQLLERAEREKQAFDDHQRVLADRERANYREDLMFRLQDAQASYMAGQDFPDAPTRADFQKAFEPDQAARHWQSFKTLQDASADIRGLYHASPTERLAIVNRNQPVAGEGFAEKEKIHNLLQAANQKITSLQNSDPAGYVAQFNPEIQSSYEAAMQGDKTAIVQYTQRTLAEQKRLGIVQPEILPKAISSEIAARFFDQKEGGQNAAQLMSQLEQEWGSSYPLVYAQLSKENKIPAAALVIPNMSDSGAKERLARWSLVDDKVFEERLPDKTTNIKDIRSTLLNEMAPFWNSLSVQNGGEKTYNTFSTQAYKLALGYAASGKTPQEAAQQAYQETVGHAYEFGPSYRVPKLENPESVMLGARSLTDTPDKLDIRALPSPNGLTPKQADKATYDVIKNHSVWVTNLDESGLILYALGNNGLNIVLSKKGDPIEMTWQQLREAGVEAKKSQLDINPGGAGIL